MANLITVDKYKELAGISSTKEDAKLAILVPSISQLVKTYCGNSIIDYFSTSKVETFSLVWDTHILQLTESPLNRVVCVEERADSSGNYTELYEERGEYFVDYDLDCVYRTSTSGVFKNWKQGAGSVVITYTAGYETCPADLELAVADLITYYLRDEHKIRQTLSGATKENPQSSLRNGIGFPDHIKRVLDMYKNF